MTQEQKEWLEKYYFFSPHGELLGRYGGNVGYIHFVFYEDGRFTTTLVNLFSEYKEDLGIDIEDFKKDVDYVCELKKKWIELCQINK